MKEIVIHEPAPPSLEEIFAWGLNACTAAVVTDEV